MCSSRQAVPATGRALLAVLLGATLLVSLATLASPGFVPSSDVASFVDFSGFPDELAAESAIQGWQAEGWTRGNGCLQLLRADAFVELLVWVSVPSQTAELTIVHRSGVAPGCADGGFAPVTVSINGIVLALEFAPQAFGGSEFSIDRFEVSGFLVAGPNRVRVTAAALCSVYELQRLELGTATGAVHPLEACQMTHAIAADLPTDDVRSFSPTDAQAVCWTRVATEAIGRRIEFRFYDPSGDLYFTATRSADRYNWGYIRLAGWNAAALQGRWRVDVTIGGCLCASVPFSIGYLGDAWRPRITEIEFPGEVTADGSRTYGWVTFTDPDADVSWVRFTAVEGLFSGFEFDPDVGGQTAGRFSFYVYTRLAQTVRLEVVLYDHAGHASAPAYLTFRSR